MSNDAFTTADDSQYDIDDSSSSQSGGKKRGRLVAIVVALAVIIGGGYYVVSNNSGSDTKKLQGKVALSEQELRDIVVGKKLTVYWAGPLAGAKYGLTVTGTGLAYIRYLPGGVGINDTKTLFRAVGTYVQKNAFAVNQNAGAQTGNVGFISADGNAVFYNKSRPTNVYIGIKDKDIQVEVFDPGVDQALGLTLIRGQIAQIK
ncbi:MAG: hypothetical protein WDO06_07585 [Actinomycetota bacterium]